MLRVFPELLVPGLKISLEPISTSGMKGNALGEYRRGKLSAQHFERHDKLQKEKFDRLFKSPHPSEILNFKPSGNRIYVVLGLDQVALPTLLPFYDQIYVQLIPPNDLPIEFYFLQHLGVAKEDFLFLVRKGRVIPVFKFGYSYYWKEFTDVILSDSLTHVGPAELDLLALHVTRKWNDGEALDQQRAYEYFRWKKDLLNHQSSQDWLVAYEISKGIDFRINLEDNFQSYFYSRGHLASHHFTPVGTELGVAKQIMRSLLPPEEWKKQLELLDWLEVEMVTATHSVVLGDALGATVCNTFAKSEHIMKLTADVLQGNPKRDFIKTDDTSVMASFLSGLELSWTDRMSLKDYESLFDSTEVSRMRKDLQEILSGSTDEIKVDNLRKLVHLYNKEIDSFAKKDNYNIERPMIDFMGQVAEEIPHEGLSLMAQLAIQVIDKNLPRLKRDFTTGKLSELTNILRGTLNMKSPRVISLHHLRQRKQKLQG